MSAKGRIHVVIGDTQVKPGVCTRHLTWIGRYIVDQFWGTDARLMHLGDGWDFPSLSSYDKGKKSAEGRRVIADVRAGNDGFSLLNEPLERANKGKRWPWHPRSLDYFLGNHEDRVTRSCEEDAKLDGLISLDDLNIREWGWTRHAFLKPVKIDGIRYAHYFYNPFTGRPYGGENVETRLKQLGCSFTMGHQQGVRYALRPAIGGRHQGLILGSTYLHDESYAGPQGNASWRGIVVKHQVENGTYDPMFVSLEYLCRRYERVTLKEYLRGWEKKHVER